MPITTKEEFTEKVRELFISDQSPLEGLTIKQLDILAEVVAEPVFDEVIKLKLRIDMLEKAIELKTSLHKANYESLKRQIEEKNIELRKRWERIEELSRENQRLGAEINGLESEIKTLKHDLAHTQGNYELAQDRLRDCHQNVVSLEALYKDNNENWLKAYHDTEARAVYHEAATATMNVQIETLEEENKALEQIRKERVAENGDMRVRVFLLEQDKEGLQKTVKEVQDELTHIQKQILEDVLGVVGTRYYEWGERALMAFKVLEGIVEEEEDET